MTCLMLTVTIAFELAKHICYGQVMLKCPSLSVCPDCPFFLQCCVCNLLVLILAVTSAFCCFSSGNTGHIWTAAEFAFRTYLNLFAQSFLCICSFCSAHLPTHLTFFVCIKILSLCVLQGHILFFCSVFGVFLGERYCSYTAQLKLNLSLLKMLTDLWAGQSWPKVNFFLSNLIFLQVYYVYL